MTSTGGSSAPFSFVMSPTCSMSGNRILVTSMGKASISLAHSGTTPQRTAASGKPPMPSNRLPRVIMCFPSYLASAPATVRVVLTADWTAYTALIRLARVEVSSPKAPAMRGTSPAESIRPSPSRA